MTRGTLPWDWARKTADFIKPGDRVLDLGRHVLQPGEHPPESFDVVLSRGPAQDLNEVLRVLKPDGFFLTERVGSEHCRALAEALLPGCRPAGTENLENELPKMRAAGFRIMFRDQAYPAIRFADAEELRAYIAANGSSFPGVDSAALRERSSLPLEGEEHRFLLIGKKRA